MIPDIEKEMILESVATLVRELENNPESITVKQMSCDHYSKTTNETFQIQVIVTKNDDDFLPPFEIEHEVKL